VLQFFLSLLDVPPPRAAIVTGLKSGIGLEAVPLVDAPTPCTRGVLLVPEPMNSGSVFFGGPDCNPGDDPSSGCLLIAAGAAIPVADASLIYVVADGPDQSVFWAAV
jgi:hypothetical protein